MHLNSYNSEEKEFVKGFVSIVILTFNHLKYTKECLESIRRYTPEPHHIIFVDNGSTDGTVKWLRQITEKNAHYRFIENRKKCSSAHGCNQGIRASSGEYILLLNNDVVVTEGWLAGMLECLTINPGAGIVGPMTNTINGPQTVANVNYSSLHHLPEYAHTFREINRHRRIPLRKIAGFCMLFKRELVKKVGLLDENFTSNTFEDEDFTLRASLEGYRNFIAGDVFIHHYGIRGGMGSRNDPSAKMSCNRNIFTDKWNGIDADSTLGKKFLIRRAIEKAEEMNQKGEIDKSVEKLIEGIGFSPETEEIYHFLADVLIDAKRFKDALDALHSMPDKAKEDIQTLVLIGYCKEGMGLLGEAQRYADRALSIDPAHTSALNLKAILAYKQGDEKTARNFFTKAIKSDPGYGRPHKNLGILEWKQGKRHEGMEMLERGFILSPTLMDIANMYHTAIIETNNFSRAEGLFKDAIALHPTNKRISYLLIDLLLQQGKYEEAMHRIEDAMILFGIEDGMLSAAKEVRGKIGPQEIDRAYKGKGTLSLSMIVKNEEQNIAKCLMSVKPVIDEMIVVDTGSTDRTKDIALVLGAKVYDFAWSDDFSEARNYSLSKASGDWILVLDADEVISPLDHAPLLEITKKKNLAAYSFITRNYTIETGAHGLRVNDGKYPEEEAGIGWYPSSKVRLFLNDRRIRFQNHVHEVVEGTIQKTGQAIRPSNIPVHHYGRLDRGKMTAKGEAYYELGKKKLQEKGDNVKALYELAVQAAELKKYEEAVTLWQKVISLNPHEPLAHFNLGFAYMELGKYEQSRMASKKAIELSPNLKAAAINYATCELYIGDAKKAISVLEAVLRNTPEFPSALAGLSAAYFIDKRKSEGYEIIEKLQKKSFDCAPFLNELAKNLFSSGRHRQALSLLEAAVETKNITKETAALVEKCCEVFPRSIQHLHLA